MSRVSEGKRREASEFVAKTSQQTKPTTEHVIESNDAYVGKVRKGSRGNFLYCLYLSSCLYLTIMRPIILFSFGLC